MQENKLFEETEFWQSEWKDMPEFIQNDLMPYKQIIINFENASDVAAFAKLIDQKITPKTKSLWYPAAEKAFVANKRYTDEP
jgi:hypothetical protein